MSVVFFGPAFAGKPANPPKVVIERFDQALLSTMKAGHITGFKGRDGIMIKAVHMTFDMPFIGHLVLGHYWSSFSSAQKAAFVTVFARLIAATYAHNFNGYGGQEILVKKTMQHGSEAFVYTLFSTPGQGHHHEFDYILKRGEKQWRIVNIITDGVSDLAIKRAEYQHFLKRKNFASLMVAMQHQIKLMADSDQRK